ncbi:hypothetical protein BOX15_Mlig032851g4 [Macrostomum lignano]|uniref:phospholipase D n=1 Tax=Macrostomum lignano TaxID=282301 RepID=A0A267EME6_9PLAT|nr:hypothetical protein BOX15_Mlig032851g4 [Macrostomum lignano]
MRRCQRWHQLEHRPTVRQLWPPRPERAAASDRRRPAGFCLLHGGGAEVWVHQVPYPAAERHGQSVQGMPFRITHCHSEFKTHPEACLLNERTHAVRVESIDSDTLPPELSDVKNLYRITFRHGAFEWRVIRTWKRKEVVNLLGMLGIPLLYNLRQRAHRSHHNHVHHHPHQQHQQQQEQQQEQQQRSQDQQQKQFQREYRQSQLYQQFQNFQTNEQNRYLPVDSGNADERTVTNVADSAPQRRNSLLSMSTSDGGCETSEKVVLSEINAMLRRLETHETTHGDSIMNPAILKFLGVSRLTFVEDAGPSLWEGEVNLRLLRNNCPQSYFRSKTRKAWMVIKDSHIAFLKNVVGQTVDLVLVDRRFKFELFRKPAQLTPTCASCCKDPGARMQLKLFNTELEAIVSVCPVSAEPLQFGLECLAANADYGNPSDAAASSAPPIKSFAPPRESTPCKWLVDGAAYFYDLAEALEQAKEEIFIADWFLSPEVLLRRPCAGYHELINILYRRATYNVQIYILIYSELTNVLNNHSQYTRKCLYEKLRKTKNIHIILHPRRSLNPQKGLVNEYLYSHHEKLAIIDQKVAFFGGLDLCWGRWDIPEHPILDNGVNITEFDVNIPTLNPSFEPYRTPDIHTDLLHYLLSFFPDDEILEHVRLSAEMEQRLNHVSVVPIWRLSRLLGFLRRQLGGDFGDATAASTTETHEQPHAAATAAVRAAAVAANALRKKALDLSRADLDGSRRLKKSSNFVAGQPKLNSLVMKQQPQLQSQPQPQPQPQQLRKFILGPYRGGRHTYDSDSDGEISMDSIEAVQQVGPAEADERASVPVSLRAVTDAATKQLTRLLMPGAPSFLDTSSEDARLANSERPRPDATTAASRDTVDTQSSAPSGGDGAAAGYEVDGRRIVAPKRVLDRLLAAEKNKDEMPSKISSSRESCPRPLMPCQADVTKRQQPLQPSPRVAMATGATSTGNHRNNSASNLARRLKRRSSEKLSHETLLQLRQRLLRSSHNQSQSPGSADGGFNSNRQREQPRRNLAGSIWKLQKNAESNRAPHDTESFSKAAKRRLQKHVDTLGSQQSQRTNPWAWYGQLNTGYALKTDEAQKFQLFRGMDYINWMLSDPTVMDKPYTDATDRNLPRSAWHDVGCVVRGQAARDVARHFIERWNYSRNRCASSGEPVLLPKAANSGLSSAAAQPHQQPHQAEDSGAAVQQQVFAEPAAEAADASKVSMRPARRSRNRSNSDAGGGRQQRNRPSVLFKSGGGGGGADEADTGGIGVVFNEVGGRGTRPRVKAKRWLAPPTHCRVRILRSLGFWSGGLSVAESSILQAYHYVIGKAEHYLYIENQFFISCCLPSSHASRMQSQRDSTQVQNNLSWSLFRKIVEMHRLGRPFRVYLVIPVLPMFTCEGMESGVLSPPVLMMLHHEYTSLFRGGASLFDRLQELDIDPARYVSVCSLRNWARQPSGQLVTEQVYVHSKVIIADDSMCIIGSANINDRSLRGDCDSEVAGLFEDTGEDLRPEVWQSGRVRVGRFAGSLRRYLMREHLGITAAATAAAEAAAALSEASETAGTSAANADATRRDSETSGAQPDAGVLLTDPTDDAVFHRTWISTAKRNRKIYEKVFRTYPNDCATIQQLAEFLRQPCLAQTNPAAAREELEKVRGHLIEHPAVFLNGENLEQAVQRMLVAGLAKKMAPRVWNAIWM